ncbi:hypothetical protein DMA15_30915 [Streptomyces sp. WAC 01529]|uniref:DUF6480 family protein n=1 Tax=Streptomyces sp. WAC 01529 TaxID=2203205 RepID=UPI000F6C802E|nr:DUF6480 family protein [Streptomyces sp. WAC 01529]AZM56445.1 hypothetical protein DMA15_30915 [Streptomyces sp. WAC 01529]
MIPPPPPDQHPDPAPDPEPDPRGTSGTQPGRGVPPGESPPADGGMSETGPAHDPPKGWSKGPLALILGLSLLIAAFFLVYALVLLL